MACDQDHVSRRDDSQIIHRALPTPNWQRGSADDRRLLAAVCIGEQGNHRIVTRRGKNLAPLFPNSTLRKGIVGEQNDVGTRYIRVHSQNQGADRGKGESVGERLYARWSNYVRGEEEIIGSFPDRVDRNLIDWIAILCVDREGMVDCVSQGLRVDCGAECTESRDEDRAAKSAKRCGFDAK